MRTLIKAKIGFSYTRHRPPRGPTAHVQVSGRGSQHSTLVATDISMHLMASESRVPKSRTSEKTLCPNASQACQAVQKERKGKEWKNGGDGGIRTLEAHFWACSFSKRVPSASRPRLLKGFPKVSDPLGQARMPDFHRNHSFLGAFAACRPVALSLKGGGSL
jgi:hypothetical protein